MKKVAETFALTDIPEPVIEEFAQSLKVSAATAVDLVISMYRELLQSTPIN